MPDFTHCPAVLALELAPDSPLPQRLLDRAQAERLAALLADDLRRLLPGAEVLHLAVAGALFDAAQLLRPGFPAFAALAELAERAVAATPAAQVVAFGAHAGAMPLPTLQPLRELGAGPLLLLPWSLFGGGDAADAIGARMETEFLARGEAGVELADAAMRAFGVRCEHARYLTRHDLCALTCVQLEHAGFSAAWELLETALLAPDTTHEAMSPRGRVWQWRDGAARTAIPSHAEFLAAQGDAGARHEWAGGLFELRQFLALFAAHALPVQFDGGEAVEGGSIETLASFDAHLPPPRIVAHEAPGLGTVALTLQQEASPRARVLAYAGVLGPGALARLRAKLT